MKKLFLASAFVLGFGAFSGNAFCQTQPGVKGYWTVETNLNEKPFTLVKMYNEQHELLYQERIEGKRLNVHRNKDKKVLNAGLVNVLEKTQLAQRGIVRGNLLELIAAL